MDEVIKLSGTILYEQRYKSELIMRVKSLLFFRNQKRSRYVDEKRSMGGEENMGESIPGPPFPWEPSVIKIKNFVFRRTKSEVSDLILLLIKSRYCGGKSCEDTDNYW